MSSKLIGINFMYQIGYFSFESIENFTYSVTTKSYYKKHNNHSASFCTNKISLQNIRACQVNNFGKIKKGLNKRAHFLLCTNKNDGI